MATFAASRAALLALLIDGGEYWLQIDGAARRHGPLGKVTAVDSVMSWAASAASGSIAKVQTANTRAPVEGQHVTYAPTGHAPGDTSNLYTDTASATATGPAAGTGPVIADIP
jgi:hypothetical protein